MSTNTTNQNSGTSPDATQSPPPGTSPTPIPYPNVGSYASGKKHNPNAQPKVFEVLKLTKKPPIKIAFKSGEPKDTGQNSDKSFKQQKWLLNTDFLNTTNSKMNDVWDWFNMNVDLSKNVCEKHKFWLELPKAGVGDKEVNKRREIVIKNWIKSHVKDACEILPTKKIHDNVSLVNMEIEDYPLVLTCAVKQPVPDGPSKIEIGLNTKAIILVEKNTQSNKIEVKAQLPNKEKFHLLPAIVFDQLEKFVDRNEVKTKEYAKDEMRELKKFATDMKKKRLEVRLKSQKLDDSDDAKLRWEKDDKEVKEAMVGEKVVLVAEVDDVDNGTEITFKIFEHDADGKHDHIKDLKSSVLDNKVQVGWDVEYHKDKDDTNSDQEQKEKGYTIPEYIFRIEGSGVGGESGKLEIKDWIEIEVKDVDHEPIGDIEFKIVDDEDHVLFEGKTDSNGYAKIEKVCAKKYHLVFTNKKNEI